MTAASLTGAAEQVANAVLAAVETPSEVFGTMIGGEMMRSTSPPAAVNGVAPHETGLASALLNTGQIIFGIIVIGVIGLVSDFLFKALNRRLFPWAAL